MGDIQNYRISFFSGERRTDNLRKAPNKNLIASEPSFKMHEINKLYKCRVIKSQKRIVWLVDNEVVIDVEDDADAPAGYFGFRAMLLAEGFYDDVRLYEVAEGKIKE